MVRPAKAQRHEPFDKIPTYIVLTIPLASAKLINWMAVESPKLF
jgi:hypothetical protein